MHYLCRLSFITKERVGILITDNKDNIKLITDFVNKFATRLKTDITQEGLEITQGVDGKSIVISMEEITDLLHRDNSNGRPVMQIDFVNGHKILLTDILIGFKPYPMIGLDPSILPSVVTTQDLYNVFEALESAMSESVPKNEILTLKKVFDSIIQGGEAIGFDLKPEKCWPHGLSYTKVSA